MRKQVNCGGVLIGGSAPISIQSMSNIDTRNVKDVVEQTQRLVEAGCDIMRLAVPDMESAVAFGKIKKAVKIPLVADIHFDYRLALAAIENGADKVRINPGNIGDIDRVKAVVKAAKERNIPIRVGVNSGSLENDIVKKYNGVTAEGLVESALRNIEILENLEFDDIVISLKSSNVNMNYLAHKLIASATEHPIHIGVTEAGTVSRGKVKSAIGIGALLLSDIGDTMRVSLTGDPINEVIFAKEILESLEIRRPEVNLVSCPTCGRTKVNLEAIIERIEEGLSGAISARKMNCAGALKPLTVAVMGCAVNGPGEAKEADFGVACGDGKGLIFSKGKIIKKVEADKIHIEILKMIENAV